eukprot:321291-Rhodomonas_salina.1
MHGITPLHLAASRGRAKVRDQTQFPAVCVHFVPELSLICPRGPQVVEALLALGANPGQAAMCLRDHICPGTGGGGPGLLVRTMPLLVLMGGYGAIAYDHASAGTDGVDGTTIL